MWSAVDGDTAAWGARRGACPGWMPLLDAVGVPARVGTDW